MLRLERLADTPEAASSGNWRLLLLTQLVYIGNLATSPSEDAVRVQPAGPPCLALRAYVPARAVA